MHITRKLNLTRWMDREFHSRSLDEVGRDKYVEANGSRAGQGISGNLAPVHGEHDAIAVSLFFRLSPALLDQNLDYAHVQAIEASMQVGEEARTSRIFWRGWRER